MKAPCVALWSGQPLAPFSGGGRDQPGELVPQKCQQNLDLLLTTVLLICYPSYVQSIRPAAGSLLRVLGPGHLAFKPSAQPSGCPKLTCQESHCVGADFCLPSGRDTESGQEEPHAQGPHSTPTMPAAVALTESTRRFGVASLPLTFLVAWPASLGPPPPPRATRSSCAAPRRSLEVTERCLLDAPSTFASPFWPPCTLGRSRATSRVPPTPPSRRTQRRSSSRGPGSTRSRRRASSKRTRIARIRASLSLSSGWRFRSVLGRLRGLRGGGGLTLGAPAVHGREEGSTPTHYAFIWIADSILAHQFDRVSCLLVGSKERKLSEPRQQGFCNLTLDSKDTWTLDLYATEGSSQSDVTMWESPLLPCEPLRRERSLPPTNAHSRRWLAHGHDQSDRGRFSHWGI